MANFTTAATSASLVGTAGTTIVSFAQAADQKIKQREAQVEAQKAINEAKRYIDENVMKQLTIEQEAFKEARLKSLEQGAIATQQLIEGDQRALAGGVGRIQLAQQQQQRETAIEQQKQRDQINRSIAIEEARKGDLRAQVALQEAIGAQEAAADAQKAEAMAIQQGMAGLTSLGKQVAYLAPLYEKSEGAIAANRFDRMYREYNPGATSQDFMGTVDVESLPLNTSQKELLNEAGSISKMSSDQFKDFMSLFSAEDIRAIQGASGAAPSGMFVEDRRFNPMDLKYISGITTID